MIEEHIIKEYPNERIEKDYNYNIYEEEDENHEEVKYEDISFTNKEGVKFDIKGKNDFSSVLTVTTPSGKIFNIDIEGK